MNDQKIIQLLRKGKRNKGFVKLYAAYPAVKKLILSKGGSAQEAEDTFQEALIIFYKKVVQADFVLSSSINTYLYSVSRFLWKDYHQKNKKIKVSSIQNEENISNHEGWEELLEKEEKHRFVEKILEEVGEKCLSLLRLFYYKQLSMKTIAEKLNYKSEKIAKNQKYKCLERARKKLKEESIQSILI